MSLPNVLTVSRVLLTIAFVYCFSRAGVVSTLGAIILFLLASWTDFYDGYYAKKHNKVTDFGKIMDPIADKFLILAAFYLFLDMRLIAAWMFIVILIREVSVTGSRLLAIRKGSVLAAEKAGKCKTVSQLLAILVMLLFVFFNEAGMSASWSDKAFNRWHTGIDALMWVTVLLTLVSGLSYFWSNKIILFKRDLNGPTAKNV